MRAYHIMGVAKFIRTIAKITRCRWLTYRYIVLLNKAIDKEIKEFRNENRG